MKADTVLDNQVIIPWPLHPQHLTCKPKPMSLMRYPAVLSRCVTNRRMGDTLHKKTLPRLSRGGLWKNLVRRSFDCMQASCKPADLYLQSPHLFWKKSKCPLNWAGGQHSLPILFVTTRLMAGLAPSLVVTSFTLGCLFSADYNNGLVFAGAVGTA